MRAQYDGRDTALHCPRRHFEMTKCLLILSVAKPREKAEAVLKTYELFICGDIHV